ncbi:MAG TPA: nuclear transport factor 2 family protein [Spongiibacteraceae bacterium]|nr:nuclear transport factor 2 family protein [Spongiibacteraceae bacterium]
MLTAELQDRKAIEEVLYRYAWMVDQREWELMDQVFGRNATIDYTSTGGVQGPYRETLQWLDRALSSWPINLHSITNISIEFTGATTAQTRCMFMAPMGRLNEDGTQHVILNGGYYLDTLSKTAEGWRIDQRICKQNMMMGALPPGYQIPK